MKETLIGILESFDYPVFLQGSLAEPGDYPDTFFTFWNFENPETEHYDNDANMCVWGFWVYFYSVDPALVNSVLESAIADLKAAGWIVSGKGYDVATDEVTHTGRAVDVLYIEKNTTGGNTNAISSTSGNS